MPYNLDLEQKIDRFTGLNWNFEKKKMFGGVGYMLNGNMAFGIHKQSLIVRTTAALAEEMIKTGAAHAFDITGRPMKGWLMITPENLKTEKQLAELLELGFAFAKTLQKK
jgi:TfoX/Sxy family transcriptional regulator of competence genes